MLQEKKKQQPAPRQSRPGQPTAETIDKMNIKSIAQNVYADIDRAEKVLETRGAGTAGIWKAPQVDRAGKPIADLVAWLETNGDPVMLPHPDTAAGETLEIVLQDAGITRDDLEAQLNHEWYS